MSERREFFAPPLPIEEEMAEQQQLLRAAFADNKENALGVVHAEIHRLTRLLNGAFEDPNVTTEADFDRARYALKIYEDLKQEFGA